MKRIICVLFSLIVLVSSTFADKSRFYENAKIIDIMYVDSEDGLRVRDFPSLKSNRRCGLTHRFPIKVVAIGKEETIDGITAPWVEILLPRYEWKDFEEEYGWVFGGYLSSKPATFSTKDWTDRNFKQYLAKCDWIANVQSYSTEIYDFYENGDFSIKVEGRGLGANGTYQTDFKNRTLTTKFAWQGAGDEDFISEYETSTYKIDECIYEFSFCANGRDFIPYCECSVLNNESYFRESYKDSSYFNEYIKSFMFVFYSSEKIFDSVYRKNASDLKNLFIRYGVYDSLNEEYMESYHDYWNPIMKEHQKKADAMR
ncbi:MAG: hypothetical protein IKQ23_13460 [Treponema sp.]|nr:hypothetical protein [Treponema sp.]MBR6145286.1 hypothetical protein [Treponema sp.]